MENMDGVLNVNKPSGMTSHDVVDYIRGITKTKKVGHTGTLDPDATGVLQICIGKATKIVQFLINENKSYRVTLRLGISTDTQDISGKIIREEKDFKITLDKIEKILYSFRGEIEQIPPMVSALHYHGKRLYKLAREGKEVDRQVRKINIYRLDLLEVKLPFINFDVDCSKGTYVRTLCADIGEKLGVGACLSGLTRTRVGNFTLDKSVALKSIKDSDVIKKNLISMSDALNHFSIVKIKPSGIKALNYGQPLKRGNIFSLPETIDLKGLYRLQQAGTDKLLGIVKSLFTGNREINNMPPHTQVFKIVKWLV